MAKKKKKKGVDIELLLGEGLSIDSVNLEPPKKNKKKSPYPPEMLAAPYYRGHDYEFIANWKEWDAAIAECVKESERPDGRVGFDIETDGKDPFNNTVHGFSLSWAKGVARYVLWTFIMLDPERVARDLNKLKIVTQGGKFDFHFMAEYLPGLRLRLADDTMMMLHILDPDLPKGLKLNAWIHLGAHMMTLAECLGVTETVLKSKKNPFVIDFDSIPKDTLLHYGCHDADLTRQLLYVLKPLVAQFKAAVEIDTYLQVPVLVDLERTGLLVNKEYLENLIPVFERCIARMEQEIYAVVGHTFDIFSPSQVGKVLFKEMGLTPLKLTKTGRPSTTADDLERLADTSDNEVLNWIVEAKHHSHSLSAYVKGVLVGTCEKTGALHADYGITTAPTFRLNCSKGSVGGGGLNVQQMPKDPEILRVDLADEEVENLQKKGIDIGYWVKVKGKYKLCPGHVPDHPGLYDVVYKARKAFVARPGKYYCSADYQAIEFRFIVNFSGEVETGRAIRKGLDSHRKVASLMYRKPMEDIIKEERDATKTLCLHPNTYVWSEGMRKLKSVKKGDKIKNSFSEGQASVSATWEKRFNSALKLTTDRGYEIVSSNKHKFWVMREGTPTWIEAGKVEPGDWMALKVGDEFPTKWPELPKVKVEYRRKKNRWYPSKRLSEDWMLFFGLILGDGNLSGQNTFQFHSEDLEELDELSRVSESVLGKPGRVIKCKGSKGWTWTCTHAAAVRFMLGLGGFAPRNKYIPDFALNSPREGICALLRGLYSTDGSSPMNLLAIKFYSTSELMAKQVHQLLLRLGIRAYIVEDLSNQRRNPKYKVLYTVTISVKMDAEKFRDEIGFIMSRKNKSLSRLLEKSRKDTFTIPEQESRLRVLSGVQVPGKSKGAKRFIVGKRVRDKLKECLRPVNPVRLSPTRWDVIGGHLKDKGYFLPEARDIEQIYKWGFLWDKLKVKEEVEGGEFVDLTVPGEHSYIAQGFITKNSYGLAYGMSPWSLKQKLNITEELAQELYNRYFQAMPKMKAYFNVIKKHARKNGYVTTYWGRRRFIRDYVKDRNRGDRSSVNTVIQSSAAEAMRIALVKSYMVMSNQFKEKAKLVATLHDQIIFEVDDSIPLEEFIPHLKGAMEMDKDDWLCPLPVDVSYGANWGELVDWKEKANGPEKEKHVTVEIAAVSARQHGQTTIKEELGLLIEELQPGEAQLYVQYGFNRGLVKGITYDRAKFEYFTESLGPLKHLVKVIVEDVEKETVGKGVSEGGQGLSTVRDRSDEPAHPT